jgi:hypothetical protein
MMFRQIRSVALALASIVVVATGLATSPAHAAPAIPMNGGQEPAGGDPDGHGFFTYSLDGTTFCWTVSWQDIAEPIAGHVHVAPRHVAGPVVIDLNADGVGGPDTSGCRTITPELAEAITADPKAYYVNLHTAEFPAGVIRGQLK